MVQSKKYYPGSPHGELDRANVIALSRAEKAKAGIKDRRRTKIALPASGTARCRAKPDATGTLLPHQVQPVLPDTAVLKPGIYSTKIGGQVLVGDFAGYAILTLTLEERATCPRSCQQWMTCYGNNMSKATRYQHGPELEARIMAQIAEEMPKHPGLLIRLHVLGDFYSWRYLCMWAELLDRYPNLAVFGFTAWPEGTKIGDGVARLREVYPHHFAVRTSGRTGRWGSAVISENVEVKRIGDAIVCPEQLDAQRDNPKGKHCGNCTVCWVTDNPVLFIEH